MQYFKGDETEQRIEAVASGLLDNLSVQKGLFYDGAYSTAPLGDMIYESGRSPLANAIIQGVFRLAFTEIYEAFEAVGTFEAYLTVFRKVFGESVVVDFTVPAPGKLIIDIEAEGSELADFVARHIEAGEYVFDEVIDDEGDNIAFQVLQGFETQYELEQMLFEMVPAGIYTEISLTIGS
jgi:hypothetical protein